MSLSEPGRRCIFCKRDSSGSASEEHIVPESLGNKHHILPPGVVCDGCNNYFAREVEKPFMELEAIKVLRSAQTLSSKRGTVPPIGGVIRPDTPVVIRKLAKGPIKAQVDIPTAAFERMLRGECNEIMLPMELPLEKGPELSRFLAKVGMEAMAMRFIEHAGGQEYLVKETDYDAVRHHARRGDIRDWPTSVRRIYPADSKWIDESGDEGQVVFEYDLFWTERKELYFVLALFGLELVLNMGGPSIDGYERWLAKNGGTSPLYSGKNQSDKRLRKKDM